MPSKRNKTIHISESTHDDAKKITEERGFNLGAYCDMAIADKNRIMKKSPLDLLDTNYLLANGWRKIGGSIYTRADHETVVFHGTYWTYNSEVLTEENFEEKLNTKTPDV